MGLYFSLNVLVLVSVLCEVSFFISPRHLLQLRFDSNRSSLHTFPSFSSVGAPLPLSLISSLVRTEGLSLLILLPPTPPADFFLQPKILSSHNPSPLESPVFPVLALEHKLVSARGPYLCVPHLFFLDGHPMHDPLALFTPPATPS